MRAVQAQHANVSSLLPLVGTVLSVSLIQCANKGAAASESDAVRALKAENDRLRQQAEVVYDGSLVR